MSKQENNEIKDKNLQQKLHTHTKHAHWFNSHLPGKHRLVSYVILSILTGQAKTFWNIPVVLRARSHLIMHGTIGLLSDYIGWT